MLLEMRAGVPRGASPLGPPPLGSPASPEPAAAFEASSFDFIKVIGRSPTSVVWLARSRLDG